ncbi:AraC family transcriptional regulator [Vibrio toranzoniae]|uniref:AraC family transcriptional regulator n=1 Tax=Vibrio toranzoniae TaxID=1194427 RepID=A0A125P5W8_9VIBR|nr:AraC family transcriptional regulator [Vibrio toranzoniae]KWU02614.1 AraC family transcriptional regulator [Vibrio toranzoniae]SBS32409.1 HTH-type transcriptional regulator ChbR [Vibrio toranzoniae]
MSEKQERYEISEKTHQEFVDQSHVLAFEELGIVQCGTASCRDFFSVYRKNQQKHMLLYTVRGKGWLESEGCRYILEPGSCITVPVGVENGFGIEEETWQIAWIFLSPDKQWENVVSDEVSYTLSPAAEVVSSCIHTLLRSIALPIDLGGAIAIHSVAQIEFMINAPVPQQQSRNLIRLRRVFDSVQKQLHKEWNVHELANLFPCSEPHFHRLCQRYYSHSPMTHIMRMRMEYAARLLRSSDWSIQHIGEIVGYPNAANFSTRFKAWSGMTPRQFKQSAQS